MLKNKGQDMMISIIQYLICKKLIVQYCHVLYYVDLFYVVPSDTCCFIRLCDFIKVVKA